MAIATIYQKFDIVFTDPGYMLQLKQALTIKPDNFFVRALPRSKTPRLYAQPSSDLLNSRETATKIDKVAPVTTAANSSNQPLYVLYGSNTGTSEAFAQRIATDAPAHGKFTNLIFQSCADSSYFPRVQSDYGNVGLGCRASPDRWSCNRCYRFLRG